MPVFVDEVIITLEVGKEPDADGKGQVVGSVDDKQALISECVERVLQILADREER